MYSGYLPALQMLPIMFLLHVNAAVNSVSTRLYSLVRVEDVGQGLRASVVSASLVLADMVKELSSGRYYVGGHHPLG